MDREDKIQIRMDILSILLDSPSYIYISAPLVVVDAATIEQWVMGDISIRAAVLASIKPSA